MTDCAGNRELPVAGRPAFRLVDFRHKRPMTCAAALSSDLVQRISSASASVRSLCVRGRQDGSDPRESRHPPPRISTVSRVSRR